MNSLFINVFCKYFRENFGQLLEVNREMSKKKFEESNGNCSDFVQIEGS